MRNDRKMVAAYIGRNATLSIVFALAASGTGFAQQHSAARENGNKPPEVYKPIPGFDTSSIDSAIDPCTDFYKFACGKFAGNHPIPSDQPAIDEFYALYNVNTQSLNGILTKAAAGGANRTANEQKIGDYYKSCMDTDAIETKGLTPIEP